MKQGKGDKAAHNVVAEIVHQLDGSFHPGAIHGKDAITREALMAVLNRYLINETCVEPKDRRAPDRRPLVLAFDEMSAVSSLIDGRLELYTIGPVERRKRIERLTRLRRKLWGI